MGENVEACTIINRPAFFARYRSIFGKMNQIQVDGLRITLDLIDGHPWPFIEDTAYYLATKLHECDATWWPIEEAGDRAYFEKYDAHTSIGRTLGNVSPGDGYRFRGRGAVMLTGRKNYKWAQTWSGFPLVSYPDGMRWPELAYAVTQEGMLTGAFTGRKLCDYPGDYRQKRRVVNGLDRCDMIAGYARGFEEILEESGT